MKTLFSSAWRAAAYCLHPQVLLWTLGPLAISGALAGALGWLYWDLAVAAVRATLEQWPPVVLALDWLDGVGAGFVRRWAAPLIVLGLSLPTIVVLALLLVAWLLTPRLAGLVAARRFPQLERGHGAPAWHGVLWSLACTAAALLALLLSLPLWLLPPLALLLPPLIWGWLAYRVFTFDVLADFATRDERVRILHEQRWPLLAIGVASGYLGAAPALVWAAGALTLVLAPVLIVVSVWLYTLVFAFSALWFAHFALAALDRLRRGEPPVRAARPAAAAPMHEAPAIAAAAPPPSSPLLPPP